jgi:GTP-binding protein
VNLRTVELVKTAYLPDQLILDGRAQVAFAGRSNVGKSSLLNRLFNRKNLAKVSQTPGKTQSINFFLVNNKVSFVDLPGYGYAKAGAAEKARWKNLLEYYFEKSKSLKGLVHLIDIRHGATDLDLVLNEWTSPLVANHLYVLTKSDKVSKSKQTPAISELAAQLKIDKTHIISFSAETGEGKHKILQWIDSILE